MEDKARAQEAMDHDGLPSCAGTIVLRLGYSGEAYSGFAEQTQPEVRTVAGELRKALETFLRREVDLTCAGRTDAGVHALSQYVSFPAIDGELSIAQTRWLRAMDALLPRDIAVQEVFQAHSDFSARFDALARTYTYRIADRPNRPVLTRDHVWWQRMPLDEEAMGVAAQHLVGEHDFKSFCAVGAQVKTTTRTIYSCEVEKDGNDIVTIRVTGNGFLYNMVRIIAGTLIRVGGGEMAPDEIPQILGKKDRTAAGPTAPAHGLTMMGIEYEDAEGISET